MKRREFLRTAGGASAAAGAAAATAVPAAARGSGRALQDEGNETQAGGNQTQDGGNETAAQDGGGGGATEVVDVGPDGAYTSFEPAELEVAPGTTVRWVWQSDGHNVVPRDQPDEADWAGHETVEDTGFEYEHTFETEGEYHYVCEPHVNSGMEGWITVSPDAGGGGGGYEPPDPAHMGVPIQKHFVGAMAFMAIFVTLVFTFYLLKYGESAHASAPSKRD